MTVKKKEQANGESETERKRERERERERWEVEFLSGLAHRQSGTSPTGIGGSP